MKKLHQLVLRSFIGPFILTFFISQFVLLMQFLWKYIDDLVGKGLDSAVILELLFYTSANLVPLALPLAILVSSIMTFGNLAEHFELTAAKSAGISLQKIMAPLFTVAAAISILAFVFANNILPYTNLKMGSLLYDIRQQKPALSIREGVFYSGIEGYSIKVGSKEKDGRTIGNVMIYDHTGGQGNRKVVVAKKGKMETSKDERYLLLTLFDGNMYEEQRREKKGLDTHPLMRNSFKEYHISFDLSQFKLNRTNEDLFKGGQQMMNLGQLHSAIDSFKVEYTARALSVKNVLQPYFFFVRDSAFYNANIAAVKSENYGNDTLIQSSWLLENALNQTRSVKAIVNSNKEELENRENQIARYEVEWHRKLSLSTACFILFLIGAPLGAIIRKGGMGMPLVVSIGFFLIYHVTSITGEKFAKEGIITAFRGMWLSSMILFPVGVFLIYKATHDSVIFDGDIYRSLIKRFFKEKEKVKILQLSLRVPFPPTDGGSIAIYNLQRALINEGASLKVLAFNTIKHYVEPKDLPEEYVNATGIETVFLDNRVKPFAALLNLFTGDSYNIVRFIRRDFDETLMRILQEEEFDIIQLESLFMAPYLDTIRRLSKAKVVLRAHNIEHLIWERMELQETNPLRKWYLGILSRRLRQYEVWSLNRVDAIAAMTKEDERAIHELGGTREIYLAPIGMNTDEYVSNVIPDPNTVFHLGAMDWLPNQEGVEWLLEKVWPELQKINPSAKLKLAGKHMPQRFLKYNSENCSVENFVEDGKAWMASGAVMAVPLFSGSGMRVKILEGMAMGRPVVTTPIGIEGIPARHGTEVMITDEPYHFARYLSDLLKDNQKATAMGKAGQVLVREVFDNAQVARGLLKFYGKLAASQSSRTY